METREPQETNQKLDDDKKSKDGKSAAPSPLSSPSHEFSFTITLHPSPNNAPKTFKPNSNNNRTSNKKNTSPSSSTPSPRALDLSPADDIFFHGHLLPLQLLSHPPISPRPSTDSSCLINEDHTLSSLPHISTYYQKPVVNPAITYDAKVRKKKSSSSLSSFFGLNKLWLKIGSEEGDDTSNSSSKKKNKKKGFDVKHFLKNYARMLEPLFTSSSSSSNKRQKDKRDDLRQRPYSFSGHSNTKEREKWMKRRAEFSAPASMRTSPTNSGYLISTPTATYSSSNEISSMEELQNAIQAAIAHCKNSAAVTKENIV